MASRFVPIVLFRGHWKALSDYRSGELRPDRWARRVLIVVPVAVTGLMFWPGAVLAAPGALLSGVALLAGSFLAAWGQVSSMRMKLTDRSNEYRTVDQFDRDALDETAAHLLVASLLSGATALMLVLGMNFAADPDTGAVSGVFAALAAGLATYVLIVFLIAVPRLYTAYANLHQVRDELSGTHKSRR